MLRFILACFLVFYLGQSIADSDHFCCDVPSLVKKNVTRTRVVTSSVIITESVISNYTYCPPVSISQDFIDNFFDSDFINNIKWDILKGTLPFFKIIILKYLIILKIRRRNKTNRNFTLCIQTYL